MSTSHKILKYLRLTHLYFGVLITPALIFFAFTGALQTFSLHETTRGSSYKPPAWAVMLAQIHKKQTPIVPARKPPAPETHNALPLKIFFLLVAIGLFTSTFSGLYMSYKYMRNRRLVTAILLAG